MSPCEKRLSAKRQEKNVLLTTVKIPTFFADTLKTHVLEMEQEAFKTGRKPFSRPSRDFLPLVNKFLISHFMTKNITTSWQPRLRLHTANTACPKLRQLVWVTTGG